MALELKIAKEEDRELWDELVERSPHGTIFHTWKFLEIMEKHTRKRIIGIESKGKLYPIMVFKGSTPIGIFPLFYYRTPLLKLVLSPPAKTECLYLGPALRDYDIMKQSKRESTLIKFHKEIDKFILSKLRPNFIMMHLSPDILDSRPFKWTGYEVEPRHTYIIDLSLGLNHIWKQFHRELRRSINKAIKKGVHVEEGSKKELEFIYTLLVKRRTEQGMHATSSIEYLTDVFQSFKKNNMKLLVAKFNKRRIGGLINLHYKNKVIFWIGAPKISSEISVNELLLWESIKFAYDQGFRYYEIMGANHPKLYTFKTKYNGDLVMYLSCRKYSPALIKPLRDLYRTIKPRYKI